MPFRDDREASTRRIETLERDLAALRPRADEAATLAKEVASLRADVRALQAGMDPRDRHRVAWVLAALAVVVVSCAGFVFFVGPSAADLDRERSRATTAESALYACESEAGPLRHEHDAARRALAEELRQHGQLVATAQITRRTGEAPVTSDDACVLVIDRPGETGCTAAVACGGVWVFPFGDAEAIPIECDRDESSLITRATSERFEYDAARRSLAVGADGWTIAMEVTQVLAPSQRFAED